MTPSLYSFVAQILVHPVAQILVHPVAQILGWVGFWAGFIFGLGVELVKGGDAWASGAGNPSAVEQFAEGCFDCVFAASDAGGHAFGAAPSTLLGCSAPDEVANHSKSGKGELCVVQFGGDDDGWGRGHEARE